MNIRVNNYIAGPVLAQGLVAVWPVCLGFVPIGLAFGVIAQKAGLELYQIGLMSVFVFAGSAQFIAVSMLSAGAGIASVIFATFAVNLRHFLMSSSMALHLGGSRKWLLSIFAYGITDESFAVNLVRFRRGNWSLNRALVVNHVSNFTWVISTVAGGYAGQFIPADAFGIDYALTAMFIGLLAMQVNGRKYFLTAVFAAVLALVFARLLPGNTYIVAASMASAGAGVVVLKIVRRIRRSV